MQYVALGHSEWHRDGGMINGAGAELFARIAADLRLNVESRYAAEYIDNNQDTIRLQFI